MATISNICKLINQKFEKENVRQIHNGNLVVMRDTTNKFVRMIPANVRYDGKIAPHNEELIAIKLSRIRNFLVDELCGEVEFESKNGLTVNFSNSRGKHSFSIMVNVHHLDFNCDSEEDSKQVYFEFFSTKA
ncbi:hypothetical protein [Acinetobacter phage AB1I1M-1]